MKYMFGENFTLKYGMTNTDTYVCVLLFRNVVGKWFPYLPAKCVKCNSEKSWKREPVLLEPFVYIKHGTSVIKHYLLKMALTTMHDQISVCYFMKCGSQHHVQTCIYIPYKLVIHAGTSNRDEQNSVS